MKKTLVFLLACSIFMNLIGCISVEMIKDTLYQEATAKSVVTQVYNYPYSNVHKAIVDALEKRLHFDINRKYTKDDTITAIHYSFGVLYAYVFELKKIDDSHTKVILRSRGSLLSVNDKDILSKYILEELEYSTPSK